MIDTTNTQELDNPTSDLEIVRRYLDQVKPPDALSKSESSKLEAQLRELMLTKNARLVAHYYSDSSLQDLADDTGGFMACSASVDSTNTSLVSCSKELYMDWKEFIAIQGQ